MSLQRAIEQAEVVITLERPSDSHADQEAVYRVVKDRFNRPTTMKSHLTLRELNLYLQSRRTS